MRITSEFLYRHRACLGSWPKYMSPLQDRKNYNCFLNIYLSVYCFLMILNCYYNKKQIIINIYFKKSVKSVRSAPKVIKTSRITFPSSSELTFWSNFAKNLVAPSTVIF